jgi:hypothetical protein
MIALIKLINSISPSGNEGEVNVSISAVILNPQPQDFALMFTVSETSDFRDAAKAAVIEAANGIGIIVESVIFPDLTKG